MEGKLLLDLLAVDLEVLFLGLSTTGANPARTMTRMGGYALALIVGAAASAALSQYVSNQLMEASLAAGAAALIYLVTEELLVEAHEVKETPVSAAMFSAGFLAIMIVDMVA